MGHVHAAQLFQVSWTFYDQNLQVFVGLTVFQKKYNFYVNWDEMSK